jgi:uncharacterized protein with von Willebrand factor type A (vWA) domain
MDSNQIQTIASMLATDFVGRQMIKYTQDPDQIRIAFADLYSYGYLQSTDKQPVKEFADTVIEGIYGFNFGYFMNALQLAENFSFELVEYLKTRESKDQDQNEQATEKKKKAIKKIAQPKINKFNDEAMESDQPGESDQSNQEYESNIIVKLAEESANDEIEQGLMQVLGGKEKREENPQKLIKDIANKIKQFSANLTTLKKTLRNISAISLSILNGIQKVPTGYGDVGYELGRDLRHVDQRELALLSNPQSQQLFKLKYAKGELLQETQQEGKGIGDLVIAIDTSGSTESKVGCKKYRKTDTTVLELEFAIAVAMSKYAIANKAKVKIILFESSVYFTSDWLRSESNIKNFLQKSLVQELTTGGTDFNDPLNQMADLMQGKIHGKNKPGLVFITDGADKVDQKTSNRVKALKQATKAKLYSYFIDDSDPSKYCQSLTSISDASFWINTDEDIDSQIEKISAIKQN